MTRNIITLLVVLSLVACSKLDSNHSSFTPTESGTYVIHYGLKDQKLKYLVLQHSSAENVSSAVTHGYHKTFMGESRTATLKLSDKRSLELPLNDTQVFQYTDKGLKKSKLKITHEDLQNFLSHAKESSDYSLKALEQFIKNKI